MWANFRFYTHGEKLMNIEPSVHSKAHTDKVYQYVQCGNDFSQNNSFDSHISI